MYHQTKCLDPAILPVALYNEGYIQLRNSSDGCTGTVDVLPAFHK